VRLLAGRRRGHGMVFHKAGFPDYISRPPTTLKRTDSTTRVLSLLTAAPSQLKLQPDRSRAPVTGTVVFVILHREKANKVFGKRSLRDCSQTTTSSASW
jgi:hypothetical protein